MPRRYLYLILAAVIAAVLAIALWPELVKRPLLGVFLALIPAGAFFGRYLKDNQAWLQAGAEASAALQAGRFDVAYALFERAEQKAVIPSQRGSSAFNRGFVRMLQGRMEEALVDLDRADLRRQLRRNAVHYDRALPYQRALCLAVLGRLDEAARAKAEGDQRRSGGPLDTTAALVDALLAARGGRAEETTKGIEAHWRQLDAGSGQAQRVARVLQAWSLQVTGGDPARVARLLHAAAPLDVPEVTTLAKNWPELRAFLSPHLVEVA